MVPPPETYDWSNVYGIAFRFQSDNNPQEVLSLNGSYAETVPLTAPEISTLFTSDANDEGPRTLGPAPVTALREAFCNSITLDMANIDELAKKGHIAQLLYSCPVQFVKPGSPNQRIRNPQEFDSAGREAVRRAEATNNPEPLATVLFNINQWKFKRNWKTNDPANYFHSIYTDDTDIPTNTNNDAVVPTPHSSGASLSPHAINLVPAQANNSVAHTPAPFDLNPATHISSSNVDIIVPSGTTGLFHTKTIDSNTVKTPSNSPAPNASRYTWTWTYSPNSELVSFRQVPSDVISFHRATSSSPPVQRQDKSPVTALSITPSALTRPGHHSPPPWGPASFRWTFNPQSDTVTFHCLPKPAPLALLWLSKRHRDALKIKITALLPALPPANNQLFKGHFLLSKTALMTNCESSLFKSIMGHDLLYDQIYNASHNPSIEFYASSTIMMYA
eukprot:jgi/Psemu1/27943/gm1.27943_g